MIAIKEIFLSNWRNKAVALFFATLIWMAAYRSEKQEFPHVFRVDLKPGQPNMLITAVKHKSPQSDGLIDFDGRVRIVFSGPRKQVDKIRDEPPPFSPVEIATDQDTHQFTQADFGFPREGVEIVQILPDSIRVTQEESVTLKLENVAERLAITGIPEGFEVATKDVKPNVIQISGPKSLVGSVGVRMVAAVDLDREAFKDKVDVELTYPDGLPLDLAKRTVHVSPTEVDVTVTLQAVADVFPVDAMRISFRVPPLKSPIKIMVDDIVGETIPVEFYGRKDEIARLRDRLRDSPGLSLGVRVPPFDREQGGQFTFTEDSLELHGFPGVQIRQHESRRKEKKAGWSYSIVPVKEAEK